MAGPEDMKIGNVQLGGSKYIDKLDKEKEKEFATKPSYTNPGAGPSIWNNVAYTRTGETSGTEGSSYV